MTDLNIRKWMGFLILAAFFTGCAGPSVVTYYPPPEPAPKPLPAPIPIKTHLPSIAFTIQVGAFSTSQRAAAYAVHLRKSGLDAYYFIDTDRLYKVRFERYDSKAVAKSRAAKLKAKGLIEDFYVVQPGSSRHHVDPERALRENLVKTANRFTGTPYRWGGESAKTGFDCSGLTMTVYRLNGLELPRNSYFQYKAGTFVYRKDLKKGDLVFFATTRTQRISHVGMYVGDGRFIHAPRRGKRIRTSSLYAAYYKAKYKGGRRYF